MVLTSEDRKEGDGEKSRLDERAAKRRKTAGHMEVDVHAGAGAGASAGREAARSTVVASGVGKLVG